MKQRRLPHAILASALCGIYATTTANADSFRVTPYVQRPATNAMSVLWLTETDAPASIRWWPTAGGTAHQATTTPEFCEELEYSAKDRSDYNTRKKSWSGDQAGPLLSLPWQHRVRIEDLAPGTRYTYVVELAGGVAYTNVFRTAPGRDTPVRFIAYSDCETEPESTGKCDGYWTNPVTGQSATYYVDQTVGFASNIVRMVERDPDFFLISGDLAQYGSEQRDWDEFWRHQAGVYNDPAGSIPIIAAPGNHDVINSDNGESGLDGGTVGMARWSRYFEFNPNGVVFPPVTWHGQQYVYDRSELFHRLDYGRVTVICMDSNNGDDSDPEKDSCLKFFAAGNETCQPAISPDFNPGSPQFNWITNQLADAHAKGQFIFVACHHMPYSVGYHCRTNGVAYSGYVEPYSARALRVLTPYMLKYGVTAWIAGHDEIMEHSRVYGRDVAASGVPGIAPDAELNLYDVGNSGDGLRGGGDGTPGNPYLCGEANPYEVFRAEVDAPPVLDADNVLVDGSRHYGHLEVNVTTNAQGQWQCTLTPVYIFVSKAKNGVCGKFERRVFNDVITIDARGRRVETTDRTIPWWRNPSVKATVTSASTGDMNTHYMNKDAGDRFLFVNHNADTRTNPAYLYSIPTLLGLDGTVDAASASVLHAAPADIWGAGSDDKWKGCAITPDGAVVLPGLGKGTARYTALRTDAQSWTAGSTAFAVTPGTALTLDGLDFSTDGQWLYSNDYSGRKQIRRWSVDALGTANKTLALSKTFESTTIARIRNISVHHVNGRELVYYGEGARTASAARICALDVTDPDDWHEVTITNAPALFGADIMNVKLSGEATRTPTLYVGTDDGRLRVFRLSHDGFRIVSALRTFEPTQIGALCGLSATPTKFRNFEVTRDGAFAFMCHDGTDGDAKRSDLKIVRTPPSRGSVYFLR